MWTSSLGYIAGWICSAKDALAAITVGLAAWSVVYITVDDYWVFWAVTRRFPDTPTR
jgi:hypothetical protein